MIGLEAIRSRFLGSIPSSPELLGPIFDALPDAVVLTDTQHGIRLTNRRFERLFGVTARDVVGTSILDLIETGSGAAGVPAGSCSTLYRDASGRELPIELVLTDVHSPDGALAGYLYTIRDVSDQKSAEEALQTSELQYRTLFEQANDALIIFEPEEERILAVNPRACELYAFERDEFIGRSLQTLTEDVGRGREAINDILQNGGIRNFESRHFRKDGQPLSLQISCSYIQFDARPAVLTIIRDISEQKASERALRDAKEAAEEATRMKSEFVAKVSHEIRTPMNGVIGMTELLMETALNDTQREYAESIAHSGESLLNLINDLLDFSKIEAGKIELERIPFDPYRMTGEVVELFAPRAESKQTRIAYHVDSSVPANAIGDPYRIRQVLTNLVSNAVKFTEGGEIVVTVSAENRGGGQTALVYEVADTGIGIRKEKQDRLFQAFTQADSATTRKFGGTGLGLAICRQLVTLMGGRIDVDSALGQGSAFRFSVDVEGRADEHAGGTIEHGLNHLRVLIVDHHESIREVIRRHFEDWDVDVHDVASGADALRMVNGAESYDIVLIERSLPDIGGLALARALRAVSSASTFRIILMTGFKERTLTEEAQSAGVDAFLPSPLWPHRLRECVASAVAEKSSTPVSVPTGDSLPSAAVESKPAASGRGRASVLLVEDNLTNQKVASAMLTRFGLEIDIAHHGAEAVEKIKSGAYDLVLMDCQMPVMDGFEASQTIREMPGELAQIPIIALTANAVKGDRERCIEAGMDDYLTKPFRPDLIRQTLARWLPVLAAE